MTTEYEMCEHGRHIGAVCLPCEENKIKHIYYAPEYLTDSELFKRLVEKEMIYDKGPDQVAEYYNQEYVDPFDQPLEEKPVDIPKEHLVWAFEILETDKKLGRLTRAEDIDPLTYNQRRARIQAEGIKDPAIAAIYAQIPVLQDLLGVDLHVDHMIPLSKGGKHIAENLQIVPAKVNLKKNNYTHKKYKDYLDE